jgi:hypothetical protein
VVLIVVYAIFALSATARSGVQILLHFEQAPLAYLLSLLAALTYIAVTIALIARGTGSRAVLGLVVLELAGVLVVGTLSLVAPSLFPEATVWSAYGIGYGFVPLLLPLIALIAGLRTRRARTVPTAQGPAAPATTP